MRKIRQHVNPLGEHFMRVRARPALRPAGLDPACRVEVELGCADAEFSFQLAANHPDWMVVGVEIRDYPSAITRFAEAGATADGNRVRFPRGMCR